MTPSENRCLAVRAEYDALADAYDRRWASYLESSLEMLRPLLEGRDAGRVLDLGCGTGLLVPRLAAWRVRSDAYVGVDVSIRMLHRALGRRHPVPLAGAVAASEALPFPAAAFDTVVTASSLHYWEDPAAGLREIARVLRPGGRLLLLDWFRDPLTMRVMDLVLRARGAPYRRMYARRELRTLLDGVGFAVRAEHARKITPIWGVAVFEAGHAPSRSP